MRRCDTVKVRKCHIILGSTPNDSGLIETLATCVMANDKAIPPHWPECSGVPWASLVWQSGNLADATPAWDQTQSRLAFSSPSPCVVRGSRKLPDRTALTIRFGWQQHIWCGSLEAWQMPPQLGLNPNHARLPRVLWLKGLAVLWLKGLEQASRRSCSIVQLLRFPTLRIFITLNPWALHKHSCKGICIPSTLRQCRTCISYAKHNTLSHSYVFRIHGYVLDSRGHTRHGLCTLTTQRSLIEARGEAL